MFEFDKYAADMRTHARTRPFSPYTPFGGGRRRAFLLWGEHCTECAAPDCFSSCDLYAARSDERCRRFEYGIFKNRAYPSAAGYGAEVVFKRWGKIEARGNATLLRPGLVKMLEAGAQAAAPALNRLGRMVRRPTKDIRWSYLTFSLLERMNSWLHGRRNAGEIPDAFVVEVYNPGEAEIAILLAMTVDRTKLARQVTADHVPPPVMERIVLPPGYTRVDLPRSRFESLIAADFPFGITLTPDGAEGAHLVFLSLDFVSYERVPADAPLRGAAAPTRSDAKCVVFDLDNTLWDGTLLEGHVRLRSGVAETIRRLDERGILISVASKNAEADALGRLRELGIEEYIVQPAIGWGTKSEGLRRIATGLNIGLDTLIFIDDSPFERDEVARALTEIEVLPDSAMHRLSEHPRLQGNVTSESRGRRLMYRQSAARQTAAAEFGSSYIEFLRSCEIKVEVRPNRVEDEERIAELVQRTNQLNFSGRKYKRSELEPILRDSSLERYVISCSDRYGSYGVVGFCLVRRSSDAVYIDDLMLSCRVQGKFVEKALLHHLCSRPDWSGRLVEINFQETDRNAPARAVLSELGFPPRTEGNLRLAIEPHQFEPDFITLVGAHPSPVS